jgi:hypothetical protein
MADALTPRQSDTGLGDAPRIGPVPIGFAADLSAAATAVLNQPTVALVTIVLCALPALVPSTLPSRAHVSPWVLVGAIAMVVFLCGWTGAERIFFLGQFQGEPVSLRHLLVLAKAFTGRFVTLGLVAIATFIPYGVLLAIILRGAMPKEHRPAFRVATAIFVVALDLALTFVPAALAFTTRSVTSAIRIGLAMIRETWPRSALYVVCPMLALKMNGLVYTGDLPVLRLIVAASLALFSLLAKGATVAFYLRQRPGACGDGAAYLQDG